MVKVPFGSTRWYLILATAYNEDAMTAFWVRITNLLGNYGSIDQNIQRLESIECVRVCITEVT